MPKSKEQKQKEAHERKAEREALLEKLNWKGPTSYVSLDKLRREAAALPN